MRTVPIELWDATVAVLGAASNHDNVLEVGLEQLCLLLDADRADGGYLNDLNDTYQPDAVVSRGGVDPEMFKVPASDPIMNSVLASDGASHVSDVAEKLPDGRCRSEMMDIGTGSMVVRRLDRDSLVFGLVCVDWTRPHSLDPQAIELMDLFVSSVLAPVLALSTSNPGPRVGTRYIDRLSSAEREVVRLATDGRSYREIADALGKSVHTIDHQLLNARRRVGARNMAQLVQMVGPELQDADRIVAKPWRESAIASEEEPHKTDLQA